jgi:hypothetical protein
VGAVAKLFSDRSNGGENVLCFADTADELVPSIAHDHTHTEQHYTGTETLRGEVALDLMSVLSPQHAHHALRPNSQSPTASIGIISARQ